MYLAGVFYKHFNVQLVVAITLAMKTFVLAWAPWNTHLEWYDS